MKDINTLLKEIKKTTVDARRHNQASLNLLKKIGNNFKKAIEDNEKTQRQLDKVILEMVQKLDRSVLELIKETE